MNNSEKKLFINEYESEFNFKKNKSNLKFSFNRTAFIFFFFILISIIFSIKIFYYGSVSVNSNTINTIKKKDFRADLIDRNGNLIARTVKTINVGIDPKKVKDDIEIVPVETADEAKYLGCDLNTRDDMDAIGRIKI